MPGPGYRSKKRGGPGVVKSRTVKPAKKKVGVFARGPLAPAPSRRPRPANPRPARGRIVVARATPKHGGKVVAKRQAERRERAHPRAAARRRRAERAGTIPVPGRTIHEQLKVERKRVGDQERKQRNPEKLLTGGITLKGIREGGAKFEAATERLEAKIGKYTGPVFKGVTGKSFKEAGEDVKKTDVPVLKVLRQTTRPGRAVSASLNAALEGGGGKAQLKGLKKGWQLKDERGFTESIRKSGAPKSVQAVGGFAGDVLLAPETWITGGSIIPAKAAAAAAAKAATKKLTKAAGAPKAVAATKPEVLKAQKTATRAAVKAQVKRGEKPNLATARAEAAAGPATKAPGRQRQGLQDQQAAVGARRQEHRINRKANRAGRRAAVGKSETRGLSLGFGPWRTKGRATAAIATKLRPATEGRVGGYLRSRVAEVSPYTREAGETHAAFVARKDQMRESRATASRGRFAAIKEGQVLAKMMDGMDDATRENIVDAAELGKVYTLPKEHQAVGRRLVHDLKQARRTEHKAGVPTADVADSGGVATPAHKRPRSAQEGGILADAVKGIPEKHQEAAIAAIERGEISKLPKRIQPAARQAERNFESARAEALKHTTASKTQPRSGLRYFAHQLDEELKEGQKPLTGRGGGMRAGVKAGFQRARKKVGTVKQVNAARAAEGKGNLFSTDIPLVVSQRLAKSAAAKATAKLPQEVLDKMKPTGGRENTWVRDYDWAHSGWKFAATVPNPGFHARNLIGDTQNAYLYERPSRLVRNVGRSVKALRVLNKMEKEAGQPGAGSRPSGKTIPITDKYGRTKHMPMEQAVKLAEKHGAIRSGYYGAELPSMRGAIGEHTNDLGAGTARDVAQQAKRMGKSIKGDPTSRRGRAWGGTKQLAQNREELLRLATFFGGLQRGMAPREAAARTMKPHFDYGDLSSHEKDIMRRVGSFYTFGSRNIPLQAKKLITNPGKYANIEKARQSAANAANVDSDEFDNRLMKYQQRGVPFALRVGDKVRGITAGTSGLPLTDLNLVPTTKNLLKLGEELGFKGAGMATPFARVPLEILFNYSTFYRGQLSRDESPNVPAPSVVALFPDAIKKKLHVQESVDKRTGKTVLSWDGRAEAAAAAVPGWGGFVRQMTTEGVNRRGHGLSERALGFLTGIRADPIDRGMSAGIEREYDQLDTLNRDMGRMRQRPNGIKSPAYAKMQKRESQHKARINQLSGPGPTGRGDKFPLFPAAGKSPFEMAGIAQKRRAAAYNKWRTLAGVAQMRGQPVPPMSEDARKFQETLRKRSNTRAGGSGGDNQALINSLRGN